MEPFHVIKRLRSSSKLDKMTFFALFERDSRLSSFLYLEYEYHRKQYSVTLDIIDASVNGKSL